MNLENVYELMERFEASSMEEMSVDLEGFSVSMRKPGQCQIISQAVGVSQPVAMSTVQAAAPQAPSPAPVAEAKVAGTEVKAALPGTFYRAAKPDEAPFVQVGDTVTKGQTIGIIEAMKMMNDITSPVDGKVVDIRVENGSVVGFDEVMFVIA